MTKQLLALIFLSFFGAIPVSAAVDVSSQIYDDLKTDEIVLSPAKPAVNQPCRVTVKVKNIGKRSLFTSKGLSSYKYEIPNFQIDEMTYNSPNYSDMLDVNDFVYYVFEGKFTGTGEKIISFQADYANELAEEKLTEEGYTVKLDDNNSATKTIVVYAANTFDLSADSIKFADEILLSGNTAKITAKFKNNGLASIVNSDWLSKDNAQIQLANFKLDSIAPAELPSVENPLDPGEYFEYTINGRLLESGNISISFAADSKNLISESNETNNTLSYSGNVYKTLDDALDVKFSEIKINEIGTSSISVSWTTDRKADGKAIAKKTMYAPDTIGEGYVSSTTQSAKITGLSPDTKYFLWARAVLGGTQKESAITSFSTKSLSAQAGSGSASAQTASSSVPSGAITPIKTDASGSSSQPKGSSAVSGAASGKIAIKNNGRYDSLKGRMILRVEAKGEAYYVHPQSKEMHYLGRPDDAFRVMREQGAGIGNADLDKIPVGLSDLSGQDADKDGLPDMLEDALGLDKNKADTDDDGYGDKAEIANGHNPRGSGKSSLDTTFASKQEGRIFLQVNGKGEAWYMNPADAKRYFLGRPADAFSAMRKLGTGISETNFSSL